MVIPVPLFTAHDPCKKRLDIGWWGMVYFILEEGI